MSEYQYFEFRTVDRTLTSEQMRQLRGYSSRARITSTSFVNEYNWGNFKGDPYEWMKRYFDAFVYVSNWGSRQLMLRLPKQACDSEFLAPYMTDETLWWRADEDCEILGFDADIEPGDWEEGEGWMDSLLPLRHDLLQGDLRCLYLGWLRSVQGRVPEDEEVVEPTVPAGLTNLTPPLQDLVAFLGLEADLVTAAAEGSPNELEGSPSDAEIHAWLARLPQQEKDEMLAALISGKVSRAGEQLRLRALRELRGMRNEMGQKRSVGPRRVTEIQARAEAIAAECRALDAERRGREQAERERAAEEARRRRIESHIGKEKQTWAEIARLIATKQPRKYDDAVSLLQELREAAILTGETDEFSHSLIELRDAHVRKQTLIRRLNEAGLTK